MLLPSFLPLPAKMFQAFDLIFLMDENVSGSNNRNNSNQISSFVLDHLFSSNPSSSSTTSSSTSPPFTATVAATSVRSSGCGASGSPLYLPLPPPPPPPIPAMSHEFDPSSLAHHHGSRGKIPEAADHDSESEEGVDVVDEPVNQSGSRGSGSKRSRAADVHNLSEKRRRSRINEKMKALQSLIPNSNKTDKASMLDEAIEYLKQLQIQVQMLSMRNGLSLSPTFLPGDLSAIQPSEMRMGYVVNGGSPMMNMSMGGGVLPPPQITQDSLTHQQQHSIHLPNQCTTSVDCSHVPHMSSDAKDPVLTYSSDPSLAHQPSPNPQHAPFNLSASAGDVHMKGIGLQSRSLGSSQAARQAIISNTDETNHEQRQTMMREYTM